jgi:hypothetical protein
VHPRLRLCNIGSGLTVVQLAKVPTCMKKVLDSNPGSGAPAKPNTKSSPSKVNRLSGMGTHKATDDGAREAVTVRSRHIRRGGVLRPIGPQQVCRASAATPL